MNDFSPHPRRPLTLLALLSLLLWLFNVAPANPAQAAGPVNNCTFQGLADALNSGNGLINFTCGPATITLTQSGGLNVDAGHFYTIDGGNLITLSGGDANRLFNVKAGGALTLTNIILSHGFVGAGVYFPAKGGALLNNGGLLVLDHATVRDSQSTLAGGGIESAAGSTIVTDSLIENNQSGSGGGIDSLDSLTVVNTTIRHNRAITDYGGGLELIGTATISNSQIVNNSADQGVGGGVASFGNVTIRDSRLEANQAQYGGAIDVELGTFLTLDRSTLSGNTATSDGGGVDSEGTATLTNVTISGNTATLFGGGVFDQGTATMKNTTISGNTATSTGGGIYNEDTSSMLNVTLSGNSAATGGALFMAVSSGTFLTNTIIAYSPSGGDCAGTINAAKYSLSSGSSCALSSTGGPGNHDHLDPLLTALGNYGGPTQVHMLEHNSPAIAGVLGNDAPGTDQRGQPRPGPDGSFDIGAVERQPADSDLAPWLYVPLLMR